MITTRQKENTVLTIWWVPWGALFAGLSPIFGLIGLGIQFSIVVLVVYSNRRGGVRY